MSSLASGTSHDSSEEMMDGVTEEKLKTQVTASVRPALRHDIWLCYVLFLRARSPGHQTSESLESLSGSIIDDPKTCLDDTRLYLQVVWLLTLYESKRG